MRKWTMRWLAVFCILAAFTAGGTGSPGLDGLRLVSEARAGEGVAVTVTVARGSRGAKGIDKALAKHASTLELVAGFGGWAPAGSAKLDVAVGGSQKKVFGDHTFEVKAESVSGGKAKTSISVTDSNGSPNTMRSSLGNGGSTVVMMRSADGSVAHAYIVTVSF